MPVRIGAKNMKISDLTKEHVGKACAKFNRYSDRIVNTEVIIDLCDNKHAEAETIVKVPPQRIVGKADSSHGNLCRAIDAAAGRVATQLKRCHDKLVEYR